MTVNAWTAGAKCTEFEKLAWLVECILLDKQMHQTVLKMCAAHVCAAHHTS